MVSMWLTDCLGAFLVILLLRLMTAFKEVCFSVFRENLADLKALGGSEDGGARSADISKVGWFSFCLLIVVVENWRYGSYIIY
jgi:hypothetical protein